MSLIKILTRRLRRDAESAYECRNCAAWYRIQYHVCPTCESFSVEADTICGPKNVANRITDSGGYLDTLAKQIVPAKLSSHNPNDCSL